MGRCKATWLHERRCRLRRGVLAVLAVILLALPTGAGAAVEAKIPVAASIIPLADFCEQIGGGRVAVQVLIPPGASPHVYEPTPGAAAQAARARLFVYVGAGLDPWAERILKAQSAPGPAVVEATAGIPLIQEVEGPGHKEAGQEEAGHHRHGGGNPHIWLDPVLAQDICRRIGQALISIDPARRQYYEENLQKYLAALTALDQEIKARVAGFAVKEFVSFHPAYAYFARRYGLKPVGVIEISPGREPSPGHLQKIVAEIRQYHVRTVFAEPQLSPRVAQVIAGEAGVQVLMLDPLGGRPPYGSDYLKLMRHNLEVMSEAMK